MQKLTSSRSGFIAIFIVFLCAEQAFSQHKHSVIQTSPGTQMLPGGIDGSVTPDQIKDSVAYHLFLLNVAEPANPTKEQAARFRAKLSPAMLSDADLAKLAPILASYRARQQALEKTFAAVTGTDAPLKYEAQRDLLTESAMQEVKTALGEAWARLDAMVQAEKRRMVVFPLPAMK